MILKKTKREFGRKVLTSVFIQTLLLIIPVYWTRCINSLSSMEYNKALKLVIITLILSLLYYLWCYFNQRAWYQFYNKIYLEYTNNITDVNLDNITLGEYTNIINNDIDIIGTFLGNSVTRLMQILEFFVIYIYFLKVDFYIFLITVIVSILMTLLIVYFSNRIEIENKSRKDSLDYKTINIHNIYDILKKKRKLSDNFLIKSTIKYLDNNANFNLFVNGMIYLVLAILELSRYLIIIYTVYLVSVNKMEIGTILLIYSYYAKILTNFEVFGTINAEWQSVKVSIGRLNRIKLEKKV